MRFIALLVAVATALPIPVIPAKAQGNCVTMVGRNQFANGCSRKVNVRWSDQGYCSDASCMAIVGAEDTETVSPVQGYTCWSVAWYPNYPPRPRC